MNSFVAHENYLKGKNPVLTYERLVSSLWTIDDIRSQFSMNGCEKPIAEQCLKELIEKQIIINPDNKDNGEPLHSVSTLSELKISE